MAQRPAWLPSGGDRPRVGAVRVARAGPRAAQVAHPLVAARIRYGYSRMRILLCLNPLVPVVGRCPCQDRGLAAGLLRALSSAAAAEVAEGRKSSPSGQIKTGETLNVSEGAGPLVTTSTKR